MRLFSLALGHLVNDFKLKYNLAQFACYITKIYIIAHLQFGARWRSGQDHNCEMLTLETVQIGPVTMW